MRKILIYRILRLQRIASECVWKFIPTNCDAHLSESNIKNRPQTIEISTGCSLSDFDSGQPVFIQHRDNPILCTAIPYASLISRTPIGQAFTQIPHAIHLLAYSLASDFTITWNGQTSTHFPQPTHSFLLIM